MQTYVANIKQTLLQGGGITADESSIDSITFEAYKKTNIILNRAASCLFVTIINWQSDSLAWKYTRKQAKYICPLTTVPFGVNDFNPLSSVYLCPSFIIKHPRDGKKQVKPQTKTDARPRVTAKTRFKILQSKKPAPFTLAHRDLLRRPCLQATQSLPGHINQHTARRNFR